MATGGEYALRSDPDSAPTAHAHDASETLPMDSLGTDSANFVQPGIRRQPTPRKPADKTSRATKRIQITNACADEAGAMSNPASEQEDEDEPLRQPEFGSAVDEAMSTSAESGAAESTISSATGTVKRSKSPAPRPGVLHPRPRTAAHDDLDIDRAGGGAGGEEEDLDEDHIVFMRTPLDDNEAYDDDHDNSAHIDYRSVETHHPDHPAGGAHSDTASETSEVSSSASETLSTLSSEAEDMKQIDEELMAVVKRKRDALVRLTNQDWRALLHRFGPSLRDLFVYALSPTEILCEHERRMGQEELRKKMRREAGEVVDEAHEQSPEEVQRRANRDLKVFLAAYDSLRKRRQRFLAAERDWADHLTELHTHDETHPHSEADNEAAHNRAAEAIGSTLAELAASETDLNAVAIDSGVDDGSDTPLPSLTQEDFFADSSTSINDIPAPLEGIMNNPQAAADLTPKEKELCDQFASVRKALEKEEHRLRVKIVYLLSPITALTEVLDRESVSDLGTLALLAVQDARAREVSERAQRAAQERLQRGEVTPPITPPDSPPPSPRTWSRTQREYALAVAAAAKELESSMQGPIPTATLVTRLPLPPPVPRAPVERIEMSEYAKQLHRKAAMDAEAAERKAREEFASYTFNAAKKRSKTTKRVRWRDEVALQQRAARALAEQLAAEEAERLKNEQTELERAKEESEPTPEQQTNTPAPEKPRTADVQTPEALSSAGDGSLHTDPASDGASPEVTTVDGSSSNGSATDQGESQVQEVNTPSENSIALAPSQDEQPAAEMPEKPQQETEASATAVQPAASDDTMQDRPVQTLVANQELPSIDPTTTDVASTPQDSPQPSVTPEDSSHEALTTQEPPTPVGDPCSATDINTNVEFTAEMNAQCSSTDAQSSSQLEPTDLSREDTSEQAQTIQSPRSNTTGVDADEMFTPETSSKIKDALSELPTHDLSPSHDPGMAISITSTTLSLQHNSTDIPEESAMQSASKTHDVDMDEPSRVLEAAAAALVGDVNDSVLDADESDMISISTHSVVAGGGVEEGRRLLSTMVAKRPQQRRASAMSMSATSEEGAEGESGTAVNVDDEESAQDMDFSAMDDDPRGPVSVKFNFADDDEDDENSTIIINPGKSEEASSQSPDVQLHASSEEKSPVSEDPAENGDVLWGQQKRRRSRSSIGPNPPASPSPTSGVEAQATETSETNDHLYSPKRFALDPHHMVSEPVPGKGTEVASPEADAEVSQADPAVQRLDLELDDEAQGPANNDVEQPEDLTPLPQVDIPVSQEPASQKVVEVVSGSKPSVKRVSSSSTKPAAKSCGASAATDTQPTSATNRPTNTSSKRPTSAPSSKSPPIREASEAKSQTLSTSQNMTKTPISGATIASSHRTSKVPESKSQTKMSTTTPRVRLTTPPKVQHDQPTPERGLQQGSESGKSAPAATRPRSAPSSATTSERRDEAKSVSSLRSIAATPRLSSAQGSAARLSRGVAKESGSNAGTPAGHRRPSATGKSTTASLPAPKPMTATTTEPSVEETATGSNESKEVQSPPAEKKLDLDLDADLDLELDPDTPKATDSAQIHSETKQATPPHQMTKSSRRASVEVTPGDGLHKPGSRRPSESKAPEDHSTKGDHSVEIARRRNSIIAAGYVSPYRYVPTATTTHSSSSAKSSVGSEKSTPRPHSASEASKTLRPTTPSEPRPGSARTTPSKPNTNNAEAKPEGTNRLARTAASLSTLASASSAASAKQTKPTSATVAVSSAPKPGAKTTMKTTEATHSLSSTRQLEGETKESKATKVVRSVRPSERLGDAKSSSGSQKPRDSSSTVSSLTTEVSSTPIRATRRAGKPTPTKPTPTKQTSSNSETKETTNASEPVPESIAAAPSADAKIETENVTQESVDSVEPVEAVEAKEQKNPPTTQGEDQASEPTVHNTSVAPQPETKESSTAPVATSPKKSTVVKRLATTSQLQSTPSHRRPSATSVASQSTSLTSVGRLATPQRPSAIPRAATASKVETKASVTLSLSKTVSLVSTRRPSASGGPASVPPSSAHVRPTTPGTSATPRKSVSAAASSNTPSTAEAKAPTTRPSSLTSTATRLPSQRSSTAAAASSQSTGRKSTLTSTRPAWGEEDEPKSTVSVSGTTLKPSSSDKRPQTPRKETKSLNTTSSAKSASTPSTPSTTQAKRPPISEPKTRPPSEGIKTPPKAESTAVRPSPIKRSVPLKKHSASKTTAEQETKAAASSSADESSLETKTQSSTEEKGSETSPTADSIHGSMTVEAEQQPASTSPASESTVAQLLECPPGGPPEAVAP